MGQAGSGVQNPSSAGPVTGSAEDAAARTAANKLYQGGLRQLMEKDYEAALATFDEVTSHTAATHGPVCKRARESLSAVTSGTQEVHRVDPDPRIWVNSKALIGIFSQTAGSTCEFWVYPEWI